MNKPNLPRPDPAPGIPPHPLRVLMVEDSAVDAGLLARELERHGYTLVWERVDSAVELEAALARQPWDLMLSDYSMPRFTGLDALEIVKASGSDLPFILISGTVGEDVAVGAMKAGAQDYLLKDRLARLGAAVERELREAEDRRARLRAEEAQRVAEAETRRLLEAAEEARRALLGVVEDLRRADAQTRLQTTALNAAANAIIVTDREGRIEWVNPAFSGLTGYGAEECLGLNPRDLVRSGQHDPVFFKNLWDTILAGRVWRGELINRRKNGRLYTEEQTITPVLDAEGQVRHFIAVKEDVTERKRAEEKIRSQAELLDLAQDAIAVRDMNDRVWYWNKSYERMTGWSAAEAVGQSIVQLVKPDLADLDRANRMLLEEGRWSGELALVRKDGRPFTVMSRWTLVCDEQGRPKSVLSINTDITEQKMLEAQFMRIQRVEGIGALASGIAHDLNNILSPVLMIAPLLRDAVPDADSRAMLDTIESLAQRGADIIKQLLTFARGTPGAHIPLPVGYLLRDMDKIIRETFPRDIRPGMDAAKDLWPVLGDATQIHQALMNLCVNARDAMPNGGTLTLGAKNVIVDEAFAARAFAAKPGPHVCVSVADTGTGIPPGVLDRIFDPFFTTKEIGKGTGLGLSTVLGIMRGHEGFVRVDSRLEHGTTFHLYFPASPQAQASPLAGCEAPPPQGRGELVLVVDDEASVRDSLRRTLETHGYQVVTAANGAEGLTAFSQRRAEVRAVLTDMMMPVMHGPAMINALRALDPRLLILGMSGLPERKGVAGYENVELPVLLSKPFPGDELLRVLHAALQAPGTTTAKGAG